MGWQTSHVATTKGENMTGFAEAWSRELPENHRNALHSALCLLTDEFFENDLEDEDHIFRELLPGKHLHLYTPLFLKKFYVTLLTVGYKLALPKRSSRLLACTAEELALHLLIQEATALLETDGIKADFSTFEDLIYQDWDFEFLYDFKHDGIEDGEVGVELGMVNLSFSEWFKPFENASMPIHPYCQDD
jgi:hypothetical protein